MKTNWRHLRLALAIADLGSANRAAQHMGVTQQAASQSISRLEDSWGHRLFQRGSAGLTPTKAGSVLITRIRRACAQLDPALERLSPRLVRTATHAQLCALAAVTEAGSTTLAAGQLGIAQPTVHRAISHLEQEVGSPLFERTWQGLIAKRPAQDLTQAMRLAQSELEQAQGDLANLFGGLGGRVVIGALPLARAALLGPAIATFHEQLPDVPVRILDGAYETLLSKLLRGEADFILGALRPVSPSPDIIQTPLFTDQTVIAHRPNHPLPNSASIKELQRAAWVVAGPKTPTRMQFDALIGPTNTLVETSSMALAREILLSSDHLGFLSRSQVEPDRNAGILVTRALPDLGAPRQIGVTQRRDALLTAAQQQFVEILHRQTENN